VKRRSYLARLADGLKGQPALRPPPVIFRPSAADTNGFVESANESLPARGAVAQTAPDSGGAHQTTPVGRAALPLSPEISSNAAPSTSVAAGPREMPISLSQTRVVAESLASVPVTDRNGQPRASASPAALPLRDMSARRTPHPELLPPERSEPRGDARPREDPAAATTLMPRAPIDRASVSSASSDRKNSNSDAGVRVRIGTLEVRISSPPTPPSTQQKPAAAPLQSRKESLARGFGSFGMAQG
jgi:hypothetical protein